jgi:hypothetical protein
MHSGPFLFTVGWESLPNFLHLESGTGQELNAPASIILAESFVDYGDRSLLEFDGFSDNRKLIIWDRSNDQRALIAGPS